MSSSSLGFVQAVTGTFKVILSPKLSAVGFMRGSIINYSLLTSSNPRHTPHYQRNEPGFFKSDCHLRQQRGGFLSSCFMDQTEPSRQDTPATLAIALWYTACSASLSSFFFFFHKKAGDRKKKKSGPKSLGALVNKKKKKNKTQQ